MRLLLLALVLTACEDTRADLVGVDEDGDEYGNWIDCDDGDAEVNPGTTEVPYNGVDDDCDPDTPDDDLDGDGAVAADDCDDTDPARHPEAVEVCNGIDDDCDDSVDDGLMATWYADDDGDGFGDPETTSQRCDGGDGAWVFNDGDCDDTDEAVNPAAHEVCNGVDDDCANGVDVDPLFQPTWYADDDSDGFGDDEDTVVQCTQPNGYVASGGDCDDTEGSGADIYPGADEKCDAVDHDCDGQLALGAVDADTWYLDADGDGYGTASVSVATCAQPDDFVDNDDDCDDNAASANPLGSEVCNGIDDDCDSNVDNGASDAATFYADADADGFGDSGTTETACEPSAGYVANDLDCDDSLATGADAYPGNTEVCDGADNDCNGIDDDVPTADVWFHDFDTDGYGDPDDALAACDQPSGYVANSGDCNDDAIDIDPDATEVCDGVDNDCDGLIDGDDPGYDTTTEVTYYFDGDGDGQGADGSGVAACSAPTADHVTVDGDCDDTDDSVYDGATPQCDFVDHDCDDLVDFDNDEDGYLDASQCAGALDCHDGDENLVPGAGCGWGRSCLEAIENNPSLVTGTNANVLIDPDGNGGGNAASLFWCDLSDNSDMGVGWTLVHSANFDTGSSNWEFYDDDNNNNVSPAPRSSCGDATILGGYNQTSDGWLHRDIDTLGVPHDEIRVVFDYYQIDTWDGGEDGWAAIERDTSAGLDMISDYTWLWFEELGRGPDNICGKSGGGDKDAIHSLDLKLWDTDDVFRVEIGSTLGSGPNDESFGVDDVSVWVR